MAVVPGWLEQEYTTVGLPSIAVDGGWMHGSN